MLLVHVTFFPLSSESEFIRLGPPSQDARSSNPLTLLTSQASSVPTARLLASITSVGGGGGKYGKPSLHTVYIGSRSDTS